MKIPPLALLPKALTASAFSPPVFLTALLLTAPLLLGACARQDEVTAPKTEEGLTLTWIQRFDHQRDLPLVEEALSELTARRIGAKIDLIAFDIGSYDQRMRTIIASGREYDLCFTSHWGNDLYGNIARGAFLPLNDLLPRYAPRSYAQIDPAIWKAVSVEGMIYAVINLEAFTKPSGIYARKSILDSYGFNLEDVERLEDLEPLLEMIKSGEEETIIPWDASKNPQYIRDGMAYMGIEEIGRSYSPGALEIEGEGFGLVNQYTLPAYRDLLRLMHRWYEKGYIHRDAAILESSSALRLDGRIALLYNNSKYGGKAELEKLFGGRELIYKELTPPYITTPFITDTAQAVSSASRHPKKALEFLELLNTDREIFNLVSYGIEGRHYRKTGPDRISLVEDSGYFPNKSWAFGNNFNAYLYGSQPDDTWERTREINDTAERSRILGFVFNEEAVKAEMTRCLTVIENYMPALWTGSIDPDLYYDEFLRELERAGADRIIREKQRQLNAWRAGN